MASKSRGLSSGTETSVTFPLFGIVATILGTGLAVALVPTDPAPSGVLLQAALAMTVGLVAAPARAFFSSPRSIVRGEHVLALAPVYWLLLDLIQGSYDLDRVGASEVRVAFSAIGLFVIAVWFGSLGRGWRLPKSLQRAAEYSVGSQTWFGVALLVFCLGMFKFAYATGFDPLSMVANLGVGRWEAAWQRGQAGGWDAILDHLSYFGYLLPSLAVLLGRRAGWLKARTVITAILAAVFMLFVAQGGGRRTVGVMVGMALILWMLLQRRFGVRGVLVVGSAAVVVLAGMQAMLAHRNVGFSSYAEQSTLAGGQEARFLHVDDNFLRTAQVISLVPHSYPHTGLQHLIYILVRPVPRVLWPGKPMDPGFDLASALGLTGVSLSSSVVGEGYLMGGLLAVGLLGWFYGRLAAMGARLLPQESVGASLMYGAWTMTLFAGIRSLIDLVLFSYVVLAWVAVVWVARRFAPSRRRKGPSRAVASGRGPLPVHSADSAPDGAR